MTILKILKFPDDRLRIKAKPVLDFDSNLNELVNDMAETMYAAPGIGLAATQVNYHQRIIVIDVSEDCDQPLCLINPEIIEKSGEIEYEEGCLSVPNYYENVKRANEIKVRALNEKGVSFEIEANEMLAVCIQHENDHLDGIVFLERLSLLKKNILMKKYKKSKTKKNGAR